VQIDSAGWRTDAHTFDIGAETIVILATRLRIREQLPLDSLALLYEFRDPITDSTFVLADAALGEPIYTASHLSGELGPPRDWVVAPAGATLRVEYRMTLETGLGTSRTLHTACPQRVRAVWRRDLLRHLLPGTLHPAGIRQLTERQRRSATNPAPLVFLFDTLVPAGGISPIVLAGC
jgi:hypothetical protein